MERESITKKKQVRGRYKLMLRMQESLPELQGMFAALREWHLSGYYKSEAVAKEVGDLLVRKRNQLMTGARWEFRVDDTLQQGERRVGPNKNSG